MQRSEIKKYLKKLDELDFSQREYEDITETLIEIWGIDAIDSILFDGLRPIRNRFAPLFYTLLLTDNVNVRNTIIGYFLATGDCSTKGFIMKYLEFNRVMMACAGLKKHQIKQEAERA